ncbi:MAG: CapA family protein [Proteobacteria bacterium]|nr:CapA family protein [Pseudomonadota bacterium]
MTLIAGCTSDADRSGEPSNDGEDGDEFEPYAPKADGNAGIGGPVSFAAACMPGARTTIGAVGDVLLHGALQQQAIERTTRGRFASLWSPVSDLLAAADTTYANLEGPTAHGVTSSGHAATDPGFVFDDLVYTSYPQFNYHGFLEDDLKASGIDVVSTANNHAMDRRQLGADRTIERLREVGLAFTGTRHRDEPTAPWHTVTTSNGFKLAWLACSFSTNGIPDTAGQVLGCWDDEATIVAEIGKLRATPGIDAVIVTPHWGEEYTANPSKAQRDLAKHFLDAGATLILGSHPHVLEPWEKYKTVDGRETFVIYSLGNFVSGQAQLARRSTIMLYVGLTRTASGVAINGVSYVPLVMNTRDGVRAVEAIDRAGGSTDARRATVGMFGTANLQDPGKPIATSICP